MTIFPYLNLVISKSFPYPSENPHPKAFIMVFISALARTLSMEAFSTLSILPLMGRMAWYFLSLAIFAEPPAESPSTMNISHLEASLLSQFASFPLESNENFCLERRFVFAFSSDFLILAAFSAQDMTFFRVSRFLSKYSTIPSPTTLEQALAASWLSSFVLVCPSNLGAGCFMETTAVRPFLTSAPVKFASFSLRMESSLAYWFITWVKMDLKPVIWVPPSAL